MSSASKEKISTIAKICRERSWKISLAESCTGGLLSSWVAEVPGVSDVFQGAIVSYSYASKEKLLGVNSALLLAMGAVCEPVAKAMARGARKSLESHWSVSITGIAGPGGGTPEKPVGTVCFAVVGPGFEEAWTHKFDRQLERQEIQRQAAVFALDLLLSAMR